MARQSAFNPSSNNSSNIHEDLTPTTSPLPPLPPARRHDHPSRQLNIPTVTNDDHEGAESQSHSAPSSPTRERAPEPPPRLGQMRQDSPRVVGGAGSRPLSMVVPSMISGADGLVGEAGKYADLHFEHRPVPKPRKGNLVNYSEVRPNNAIATVTMPDDIAPPTLPVQDRPNPPVPPRPTEEVPPPPPPMGGDLPQLPPKDLFDSLPPSINSGFLGTDRLPSYDQLDSNQMANFEMDFPSFDEDIPWGGGRVDPSYDTPPLPHRAGPLDEEAKDSDRIYANELSIETADMTGSSAYEDAGEIIRAAIERRSKKDKEGGGREVDEHGYHIVQKQQQIRTDNNGSPVFDLPGDLEPLHVTNVDDDSGSPSEETPYDFPTALQRHPTDAGKPPNEIQPQGLPPVPPSKHDEPHMELLTFTKKVSPAVERKNLDLPPLPERNPPAPVNRSKSVEPPPRPRHFMSPPPAQTPQSHEPPLPPRNPPSKVSNGPPVSSSEPPLPPRNPRVSASPGPPPSQATPPLGGRLANREAIVSELVGEGYSRSDVVKALAIAQNNLDLAKMILSGFGVKN